MRTDILVSMIVGMCWRENYRGCRMLGRNLRCCSGRLSCHLWSV